MYSIRCEASGKFIGYMSHRGRTAWTLRTARKYAKDATARHGWTCIVEPA